MNPPPPPPRRRLRVLRTQELTVTMRRVVLGGEALAGFASLGFDDHIKLFFAEPGGGTAMRDFTPRHHDPDRGELTIDFALHARGPASDWARQAAPGWDLHIAGPRGTRPSPAGVACQLLVGDQTALPAIARRMQELPADARVIAVIEGADRADRQALPSAAQADIRWVFRDGAPPGSVAPLLGALAGLDLPAGCHAWVAAEIELARALRTALIAQAGLPRAQIRAAGYWRSGETGSHTRIED